MNSIDLQHYAIFLSITFVFILLTMRVFYYAMIAKVDPIKAVKPTWQWKVLQWAQRKKSRAMREACS